MAGIATVTSPMGTASNCAARSLGEDSTSPSAGIHLYTLLLFFPSAGVHLRGTRWGRGWRGVAVRRDFGHPSFRFVSWTSGSWMPGVGSIGVTVDDSLLLPVPDPSFEDLRLRAGSLALATRRHRSLAFGSGQT